MREVQSCTFGTLLNEAVVIICYKDEIIVYSCCSGDITQKLQISCIAIRIVNDTFYLTTNDSLSKYDKNFVLLKTLNGHRSSKILNNKKYIFTQQGNCIFSHSLNSLEVISRFTTDNNDPIFDCGESLLQNASSHSTTILKNFTEYSYNKLLDLTNTTISSDSQTEHNSHLGNVVIQNIFSSKLISHFRAHSNAIAALKFNSNQTLLITASMKGTSFYVFEIIISFENSLEISSAVNCLYKLDRGYTQAHIKEFTFSFDSKFLLASSARHTRHLYIIEPVNRERSGPKMNSKQYALGIVNGLVDEYVKSKSFENDQVEFPSQCAIKPVSRIKPVMVKEYSSKIAPLSTFSQNTANEIYLLSGQNLSIHKIEFENMGNKVVIPSSPSSPSAGFSLGSSVSPKSSSCNNTSPLANFLSSSYQSFQNTKNNAFFEGGKNVNIFELSKFDLSASKIRKNVDNSNFLSTADRENEKSSWMAEIELSTFDSVSFGTPLWLNSQFKFFTFKPLQGDVEDNRKILRSEVLFFEDKKGYHPHDSKRERKREASMNRINNNSKINHSTIVGGIVRQGSEPGRPDYTELPEYEELSIRCEIAVPWSFSTIEQYSKKLAEAIDDELEVNETYQKKREGTLGVYLAIIKTKPLNLEVLSFEDAFHIELEEPVIDDEEKELSLNNSFNQMFPHKKKQH
ncbi:hypothetical protein HDU92_005496 [Lobulomyces angularis]|nr:hypothetical protein HDU92_005496 [Lobulomyces angularis]